MEAITAHTSRLRQQSRTRQLTAFDPLNEDWVVRVGGGSETLFVDQISYPQSVTVGDPIDVSVEVVNAAISVGPFDDDQCNVAGGQSGYSYDVTVDIEGAEAETRQQCLQSGFEKTHDFDLQAPSDPGSYTMTISVEGTGTGFSGSGSREIEVVAEGDDSDRGSNGGGRVVEGGGDDDSGRAGDGDGDGLPELGTLLGPGQALTLGAGAALLLVLVVALR